jgi:hypothetical protein
LGEAITKTNMKSGNNALIVQHCAVFGRLEAAARTFEVGPVKPYGESPCSVTVAFTRPKQRGRHTFTIVPDNRRYLTIEVAGKVVYDSRQDVPCDMVAWRETKSQGY